MFKITCILSKILILSLIFTAPFSSIGQSLSSEKYSIKYVSIDHLAVKKAPSSKSAVLSNLLYLEKITITDEFEINGFKWCKVIYPVRGFVGANFLISEKELDELRKADSTKAEKIERSSVSWSVSVIGPDADINEYRDEGIEELYSEKDSVRNIYIFSPNTEWYCKKKIKIAWCESFDKDQDGYLSFSGLCINLNADDFRGRKLKVKIFIREQGDENYRLYFTSKEFEYQEPGCGKFQVNIGTRGKELKLGTYNFRVDVYESDINALLISLDPSFAELDSKKFETEKYDDSEVEFEKEEESEGQTQLISEPAIEITSNYLSLFGVAAIKTYPIEKSFTGKKFNFGGNLEYSRSNWCFGFGFGYNQMKEAINGDSTKFKTSLFYLYAKLSFSRLAEKLFDFQIDPDFDFYMHAGATKWKTKFQKIKYNGIKESYHIEMENDGYGYMLGVGTSYVLYNFIIGLQYQLFHSDVAKFSKTIDYKTFEGQHVSLIDNYDIYPGFQQIQFILGYRLQF